MSKIVPLHSSDVNCEALLEAALSYADHGWRVVPLHSPLFDESGKCVGCSCESWQRRKNPEFNCPDHSRGKHPRFKSWPEKASTQEDTIRRWWSMKSYPDANLGVATGPDSFLLVDIDGEAGAKSLENREWPQTPTSKTGNGKHCHFAWPEIDFELKNDVEILPGVDIRVKRGLAVMPPSIHYSGKQYEWLISPEECHLAELPAWFIEIIREKAESRDQLADGKCVPIEGTHSCCPNDQQVIDLASRNPKFAYLYDRDERKLRQWYPQEDSFNDSAADMALFDILAFCTRNPEQIIRVAKTSKLSREKWDRDDYLNRTVNAALRRVTDHYDWSKEKRIESYEEIESCPCDIQELLATYKKWLHIEDDYNITAPMCSVVADFCPGDPDIIGIIGPSGSTKTEMIRSLGETQNQFVYPVSAITEHTLVSGHKDSKDIVPMLKGRILTIKDLTSILARKEDVRAGIFADFRELTDGYIRKEFGNGISKEYKEIHSSILFASTNAIERYYSMYSSLGQRMLFLRPKNNPQRARKRSIENRGKQKEMRAEIHSTVMRFISTMKARIDEAGLPSTPDQIQDEMGEFYDFLAVARTQIHHDYRRGEMDELPEPEFPTRIANTVSRLCEVHALFYGRENVGMEDVKLGCRILLDNIPTLRWEVLEALTMDWMEISLIAKKAKLSTGSTRYCLEELVSLKLVERIVREEKDDTMDRRSDSYKLTEATARTIEKLQTRIGSDYNIINEHSELIDIQNTSLSNPCPQSVSSSPLCPSVVLDGVDCASKIGPHPRRDKLTPMKPKKRIVPLRFIKDFAGYKKDDVVGIEAQGDLCVRPGICEQISCGQCPTALKGARAVCDPCKYLGEVRADA